MDEHFFSHEILLHICRRVLGTLANLPKNGGLDNYDEPFSATFHRCLKAQLFHTKGQI